MTLPSDIENALQPLFSSLPIDRAMNELVVTRGAETHIAALLERLLEETALVGRDELAAGLWLYVDDLDRSHRISQQIDDTTGSFWHGIMHRREGDFSNSHYWFRRVGNHPAFADIPNYDPHAFIDEVEAQFKQASIELVAKQRLEWLALFTWCAKR